MIKPLTRLIILALILTTCSESKAEKNAILFEDDQMRVEIVQVSADSILFNVSIKDTSFQISQVEVAAKESFRMTPDTAASYRENFISYPLSVPQFLQFTDSNHVAVLQAKSAGKQFRIAVIGKNPR